MDIIEILKEYGVAGLAILGLFPTYNYLWRNRKAIESIPELKTKVENVHVNCLIRPASIEAIKTDINQLKVENAMFKVQLGAFEEATKAIINRLDKIYDHIISESKG